jgi:hypothetical protein
VISLRYHIVTIVAVFLALAIGLLAGSAYVEPGLVDQLQDQTNDLTGELREREAQLSETRAEVEGLDAFVDAALPYLTQNRLLGVSVVVLAQEGVEDSLLGEAQRSLLDAGANVPAVISVRNEVASEDPDTRARLEEALGTVGVAPEDLPGLAASAIAARLANGRDGDSVDDDLLARLLSDGFLAPVGSGLSEGTLEQVGSVGQVVVVLGGGQDEEPAVGPDAFLVPLVEELATLGVPVAAGESATTAVRFVEAVRGTDGVVTVDDLDLTMGGVALVVGVDRLLETGEGGAYGVKDGAEVLPPLP